MWAWVNFPKRQGFTTGPFFWWETQKKQWWVLLQPSLCHLAHQRKHVEGQTWQGHGAEEGIQVLALVLPLGYHVTLITSPCLIDIYFLICKVGLTLWSTWTTRRQSPDFWEIKRNYSTCQSISYSLLQEKPLRSSLGACVLSLHIMRICLVFWLPGLPQMTNSWLARSWAAGDRHTDDQQKHKRQPREQERRKTNYRAGTRFLKATQATWYEGKHAYTYQWLPQPSCLGAYCDNWYLRGLPRKIQMTALCIYHFARRGFTEYYFRKNVLSNIPNIYAPRLLWRA